MPDRAARLRAIRQSVAVVGRLSDSLVRLGPFSLGIDGVLSWIPVVGESYGFLAGAFILVQGARAGVPGATLAQSAALLAARAVLDAIPVVGAAASDLFTAHRWSAGMVVRAIDDRLDALARANAFTTVSQ